MRNYYLILFIVLICNGVIAQDFNMANGSITTCSGTFYDNGGATGNYTNTQNLIFTINPNTAGSNIQVTFNDFELEGCCDFLYVYNGSSTAAPLIGTYNGTTLPPVLLANNATGSLTFQFTSDGSVVRTGWRATISCSVPCQTITPSITSTTPAADPDNIIRLCQGESLTFNGTSTFSNSATGAIYTWFFGDGTTATGQNVTKTYNTGGGYSASLSVSVAGCSGVSTERIIQVSTTPTFNLSASPQELCDHRTSELYGIATPVPFEQDCTPPISGVTFLPDGGGVDYETSIVADCYPMGAQINAASDITSICLTVEHSYLGDLSMRLRCPNGQTITLKDQGNNGTFLGDPIDDLTSGPGVGWEYCFTPTATVLMTNAPTINAPFENSASIAPGSYLPTQPFTGLIGCPLNGNWTIEITDHLTADDGYIFEWGITLAENLSNVEGFTPVIVSQSWIPATSLTSVSGHNATAFPTNTGTHCYTYQAVDNFGCTYSEDLCLDVFCTTLGGEFSSMDAVKNSNQTVSINWSTTRENNVSYYEVQRMDADFTWQTIARTEGLTNANELNNYTEIDYSPMYDKNYYRVKQVDNQGAYTLSPVKVVSLDGGIFLYPNPARDQIEITGDKVGTQESEIYDAMGKLLISTHSTKIELSNLSPGIYQVKVGSDILRFIKQ